MTEDMIFHALARLEAKLDQVIADGATTRESLARLQVQAASTAELAQKNARDIETLKGFRAQILGAVAAAGGAGGIVAWALQAAFGG